MITPAQKITRIISGGQTGADRAALDFAMQHGISCGGACPKGRRAEDGAIPAHYPMEELSSSKYEERTLYNVAQSDATLIISPQPLTGGTAFTLACAKKAFKPCFVWEPGHPDSAGAFLQWWQKHDIEVLNVAGPRASTYPAAYADTFEVLCTIFEQKSK